jgi:SOS-response transcriptional repressor LexA
MFERTTKRAVMNPILSASAPQLTARQQELLDYLRGYQRTNGVMPSTRDIQRHFGFSSQTAAMSHLRALEKKGGHPPPSQHGPRRCFS